MVKKLDINVEIVPKSPDVNLETRLDVSVARNRWPWMQEACQPARFEAGPTIGGKIHHQRDLICREVRNGISTPIQEALL